MAIEIRVLGALGHRKFAPMTADEARDIINKVENGRFEDATRGQYYIINDNTHRVIGKLDIKDGQKLILVPAIRGG